MKAKFLIALLGFGLALPALAHGPSRQKVTETVTVQAPAAEVWALISDFCSIETWHPGVKKCTGTGGNEAGATRVLEVGDAGLKVEEELLQFDAATMTYKYRITKTAMEVLPVTTYSAFVSVKDNGDGSSTVEWRSGFYRGYPNNNPPPGQNDEAAVKAVTATYQAGLANIKKLAEQ